MLFIILLTIFMCVLIHINYNNYFLNLIQMYKQSTYSVNVVIQGGLGNRLMSFAGIIVLSIYYKSKPFSILFYIFK